MAKPTTSIACVCALLLAGCGSSASTSTSEHAHAQACVGVVKADARYKEATKAQSTRFLDQPLAHATVRSIEGLQASVEGLARATSGAEKRQAAQLAGVLSRQRATVLALAANDIPAARKYGAGLNIAVERGLANLARLCPGA